MNVIYLIPNLVNSYIMIPIKLVVEDKPAPQTTVRRWEHSFSSRHPRSQDSDIRAVVTIVRSIYEESVNQSSHLWRRAVVNKKTCGVESLSHTISDETCLLQGLLTSVPAIGLCTKTVFFHCLQFPDERKTPHSLLRQQLSPGAKMTGEATQWPTNVERISRSLTLVN